jgi:hypothetical protein
MKNEKEGTTYKTVDALETRAPVVLRVVTRTFSDGRTDGRSDDGRGGVRDLDAL